MPAMGVTGEPPDMRLHDGRGWAPTRTWHTPRSDSAGRSVKASAGRARREALSRGTPSTYVGGWDATFARASSQPGVGQTSLRAAYQRHNPPLPGPTGFGEGEAHLGFHPQRGVYGQTVGWDRYYSTKKEPPEPPMPQKDSDWPVLMGGRVVAGGLLPPRPLHHLPGYRSPDAALVGDDETTALAYALKRRQEAPNLHARPPPVPSLRA